jgi:hypothetical protein
MNNPTVQRLRFLLHQNSQQPPPRMTTTPNSVIVVVLLRSTLLAFGFTNSQTYLAIDTHYERGGM